MKRVGVFVTLVAALAVGIGVALLVGRGADLPERGTVETPPPVPSTPEPDLSTWRGEAAALSEDPDVRGYFAEIALDQEYGEGGGILRKWVDDIRLAVYGDPSPADRRELDRVVAELNALLRGIHISIETHRVNAEIHFTPERRFAELEPNYRPRNYGFFWTRWNAGHEITWARILIDTEIVTPTERAHLVREELTQCLGLMQDSPRHPDSIFQAEWTEVTEFTPIDRALIYLLYEPALRPGMRRAHALSVLASP